MTSKLATARSNSVVEDRKSTRLNSSHLRISYAVFCLKKKSRKTHLKRESGATPELPRSGKQERTLQAVTTVKSTGRVPIPAMESEYDWEAGASRQPASPKTCRKTCPKGMANAHASE